MNAIHSCVAAIAAPVLVAGALAFCPVVANAQTITGEDKATTEVTIAAGPGWGQKTQVVPVDQEAPYQGQSYFLATTGDDAPWTVFAIMGVVAAGAMALAIGKEDENGKEVADGDNA